MNDPERQVYIGSQLPLSRKRPESAPFRVPSQSDLGANMYKNPPPSAGRFRNMNPVPKAAWESQGSANIAPVPSRLRVHIQSIAQYRPPERLAEDVVQLHEELSKVKETQYKTVVEKRRMEGEVSKLKANLTKAEELLNTRERILSPTQGLSKIYKSPDTTSLVHTLKEQNRAMKAAQDKLTEELSKLQKSIRATRVAELESERTAYDTELKRQREVNIAMKERMLHAEATAQESMYQANEAMALVSKLQSAGDSPIPLPPPHSLAGTKVRKTLNILASAQKAQLSQVAYIRSFFSSYLSEAEFIERAQQRPLTSGAPEVWRFLKNTLERLQSEMRTLPGYQAPEPERPSVRTSQTSEDMGIKPPRKPNTNAVSNSTNLRTVDLSADMLTRAIAELVSRLRNTYPEQFTSDPNYESSMQQLADVMNLFVEEVKRLEGERLEPETPPEEVPAPRMNPVYAADPTPAVTEEEPSPEEEREGRFPTESEIQERYSTKSVLTVDQGVQFDGQEEDLPEADDEYYSRLSQSDLTLPDQGQQYDDYSQSSVADRQPQSSSASLSSAYAPSNAGLPPSYSAPADDFGGFGTRASSVASAAASQKTAVLDKKSAATKSNAPVSTSGQSAASGQAESKTAAAPASAEISVSAPQSTAVSVTAKDDKTAAQGSGASVTSQKSAASAVSKEKGEQGKAAAPHEAKDKAGKSTSSPVMLHSKPHQLPEEYGCAPVEDKDQEAKVADEEAKKPEAEEKELYKDEAEAVEAVEKVMEKEVGVEKGGKGEGGEIGEEISGEAAGGPKEDGPAADEVADEETVAADDGEGVEAGEGEEAADPPSDEDDLEDDDLPTSLPTMGEENSEGDEDVSEDLEGNAQNGNGGEMADGQGEYGQAGDGVVVEDEMAANAQVDNAAAGDDQEQYVPIHDAPAAEGEGVGNAQMNNAATDDDQMNNGRSDDGSTAENEGAGNTQMDNAAAEGGQGNNETPGDSPVDNNQTNADEQAGGGEVKAADDWADDNRQTDYAPAEETQAENGPTAGNQVEVPQTSNDQEGDEQAQGYDGQNEDAEGGQTQAQGGGQEGGETNDGEGVDRQAMAGQQDDEQAGGIQDEAAGADDDFWAAGEDERAEGKGIPGTDDQEATGGNGEAGGDDVSDPEAGAEAAQPEDPKGDEEAGEINAEKSGAFGRDNSFGAGADDEAAEPNESQENGAAGGIKQERSATSVASTTKSAASAHKAKPIDKSGESLASLSKAGGAVDKSGLSLSALSKAGTQALGHGIDKSGASLASLSKAAGSMTKSRTSILEGVTSKGGALAKEEGAALEHLTASAGSFAKNGFASLEHFGASAMGAVKSEAAALEHAGASAGSFAKNGFASLEAFGGGKTGAEKSGSSQGSLQRSGSKKGEPSSAPDRPNSASRRYSKDEQGGVGTSMDNGYRARQNEAVQDIINDDPGESYLDPDDYPAYIQ